MEVGDADVEVSESLGATGHAVRIESDEFEGNGLPALTGDAAHRRLISDRADEADQN